MAKAVTAQKKPAGAMSGNPWPADKVERRSVADLVPYARNARTHSDASVAQLAASIQEWGWTIPVLVDEGNQLIAGHGRVLAAQKLGIVEIPVMVAVGWSEAQKRAYVVADNKLALNAGWDQDLLKIELSDVAEMGFGLELTGFSVKELGKLFDDPTEGLTGEAGLGDGLQYQVVLDCTSETDQANMLQRLRGEGRECRPLTL